MAYIRLPVSLQLSREFPGIVGPMTFRPETTAPINALVNILLCAESTLSLEHGYSGVTKAAIAMIDLPAVRAER